MSRKSDIEVVLCPPPDPSLYERVPPSETVLRVVNTYWQEDSYRLYLVEFEDGALKHVSTWILTT